MATRDVGEAIRNNNRILPVVAICTLVTVCLVYRWMTSNRPGYGPRCWSWINPEHRGSSACATPTSTEIDIDWETRFSDGQRCCTWHGWQV